MKTKLFTCVVFLVLLPAFFLSAGDFGLLLEGSAVREINEEFEYGGALIPWFSTPVGAAGNFYFSVKAGAEYKGDEFTFVPELLRTEFAYRWDGGELKLGRILYADPLGFIANGFFDGARVLMNLGEGSLGAGVWYTGLLYKTTANITMTGPDLGIYNTELDFGDFMNTYFAPRRLLAALDWQHPAVAERIRLKAALIGQMDLSGNEYLYHSQYLALKAGIPAGRFSFDLGACAELAQAAGQMQFGFAGELGISWMPPLSIPNRLMLLGRFSGGTVDDTITAFVPITTVAQGNVLKAKLSGLSTVSLEYTARLHKTLSFSIQDSYFILSDLGTYQGLPSGKEGHFLGNEVYGFLVWSPVSDLQLRGGGGVFLPSLGDAEPDSNMLWRAELTLSLALL